MVRLQAIFLPAIKPWCISRGVRLLCGHAVLWHSLSAHHCVWSILIWGEYSIQWYTHI